MSTPFIDWILTQDPERPVDHRNWGTCVVGEYWKAAGLEGVPTDSLFFPAEHFGVFSSPFRDPLLQYIGNGGGDSYGDIQRLIQEKLL